MKKFIKSAVIATAASAALLANAAVAADQKIGVVNFQEVMAKIPQSAAVVQSLKNEFKDQEAVIAQLEKDIKYFQEKKQRDSSLMSEKEKTELDTKIGELFKDYQAKGAALQQAAGARQKQEQGKIIALVRQAVDSVAAKNKFDLVLQAQAVAFVKPDANITDKVVEQVSKLNK